jgi:hypothetical protein
MSVLIAQYVVLQYNTGIPLSSLDDIVTSKSYQQYLRKALLFLKTVMDGVLIHCCMHNWFGALQS